MRYPVEQIPADVAADLAARGGTPFTLYKVLSSAPAIVGAWIQFAWRLRLECRTPRALRELLILRAAQLQNSPYEWSQHREMARAAGVLEEKVAELAMWRVSAAFDDRERAALAMTEAIVAGSVDDATHAMFAAQFDREECLELTVTAAFYCMVARVLSALDLRYEGEGEDAAVR